MDITDKKEDVPEKKNGYFQFVFQGKDNYDNLLNMIQYFLYGVIPAVIVVKVANHVIPDYDPSNSYIENLAESLANYGIIILGIWIIDRSIRYLPTWSSAPYHEFNYTFIVATLVVLGAHGKRIHDSVNQMLSTLGVISNKKGKPNQQVVMKAPVNPAQLGPPPPIATQQDNASTSVPPLLPSNTDLTKMPTQQSPDFNAMYQHNNTPLQDAATPSATEPLAANDLSAGAFGASSW